MRSSATAAVAALVVTVAAVPATAAGEVVTEVSAADRAAALSHWTPERIAQLGADDRLAPAETTAKKWDGQVPSGVGRLFVTFEPGGDMSCTATVVPSPGKDVALTAGHCLNGGFTREDDRVKTSNAVFVPGYADGKQPHGMFPVRAFAWSAQYDGPSSSGSDDAVIALDPVEGHHVEDVAGSQRISFDPLPSTVDTTILGYPVSRLARGESLVSCALPATYQTNSAYSYWQTNCDMAGGASGGPWLRDFDPATGDGTLFSVTSKGTMREDGTTADLSGAAFTDDVRALYERSATL
ncbi:peptidase [Amycolatopsis minnesotensis]|uniref:Peptidase n=1 Tax=Amycolatopsis minnesotensis TaxID=337894 RepID=A0ABN2SI75_9PSEU